MNDPNKRIDVNISSLLSLKAELLRKQQEVSRTKAQQSVENFIPKNFPKSEKEAKDKTSQAKVSDKSIEIEDSELLNKSKRILEAKSKLYDKMTATGGSLNSDENCLVMFNQKKQIEQVGFYRDSSSDGDSESGDENSEKYKARGPEEDWVEYTDCLGRTRKCLKKDLEFFKKKDTSLAETLQERIEKMEEPKWIIDTKGTLEKDDKDKSEEPADDLLATGIKIQQMREQWDQQEIENYKKDFVHYQDVLFDEARTHGVGYYQFSTDEEERAKQQKELESQRKETLAAQNQKDAQRKQREQIIAARVKAARNRQRARMGLPPEEDEPEKSDELYNAEEEREKQKEEENKRLFKEEEEKKREDERKRHLRPWDKGKSHGSATPEEWTYKPEREPMSQEQWNDMKRQERPKEFAPLVEPVSTSKYSPKKYSKIPEDEYPPGTEDIELEEDNTPSLFFTSKKKPTDKKFSFRNYAVTQEKTIKSAPIQNELNNDDVPEDGLASNYKSNKRKGAEIPPPATFDYYGPSGSKEPKRTKGPSTASLESSIEAGLKFLRNQSDKGQFGTKSKWSANADY